MRPQSASVTGVAASAALPLDPYTDGYGDGIYLNIGAGCTASVQVTPDDVFNPAITPNWYACGVAGLTAQTAGLVSGSLIIGAKAVRLNQTAGAGTSTIQTVTRGVTG